MWIVHTNLQIEQKWADRFYVGFSFLAFGLGISSLFYESQGFDGGVCRSFPRNFNSVVLLVLFIVIDTFLSLFLLKSFIQPIQDHRDSLLKKSNKSYLELERLANTNSIIDRFQQGYFVSTISTVFNHLFRISSSYNIVLMNFSELVYIIDPVVQSAVVLYTYGNFVSMKESYLTLLRRNTLKERKLSDPADGTIR
jgi:predicted PurR-regulated permease PerM